MQPLPLMPLGLVLLLGACSVISTTADVAGTAVSTTVDVAGTVIETTVDTVAGGDEEDDDED